jgi:predicted O-methyltransferase YrrM
MEAHHSSREFDNEARWAPILAPYRDKELSILEIGSARGASALTFLELLPYSRIVCIDTFGWFARQEEHFDAAMAPFASRVEKIKSRSFAALDALAQDGRTFDLVYVDGSHARDDALMDSLLAWRLLKDRGLMIWDDYVWELGRLPSAERPKQGIDLFLDLYAADLSVIEKGYQVIAKKTKGSGAQLDFTEGFVFPRTPRNLLRFLMRRPLQAPHHGR